MFKKQIISPSQFSIVVFMFTVGSSILLLPSPLASISKQNSWLSGIFALGIGLLLVWLYILLWKRFTTRNFVEYCESVLGVWLGKFICILFFLFSLLLTSLVLRNIGDFMTTQIMPETPLAAIHIFFLLVVIVGARYGLETVARISELFFPWVVMLFLFLLITVIPQAKIINIQPFLEGGIKTVIKGSFPFIGTPLLELVLFLVILPSVEQKSAAAKGFFIGTLLGGGILIIITALSTLVLGLPITTLSIYPSYILAQKINIGNFLERIEAVLAILWMMTIFIKTTICYYTSIISLSQILRLSDYRSLLLPMGPVVIFLSIVSYPNVAYFITVIGKTWFPFALSFGLFLPLLLLAVDWMRSLLGKRKQNKNNLTS